MAEKKKKKTYYVKGWDNIAGRIEGETMAFSADQAASFVAKRSGIHNHYRLRVFIDTAEITLVEQKKPEQLSLF